ncbi:MAG: hypothetical protein AB1938_18335 [Myxococcota bacterium]
MRHLPAALLLFFCACPGPAPAPTDGGVDGGGSDGGAACQPRPSFPEDAGACLPLADDYQPRFNGSSGDGWPACVSDSNTYTPINPSISTVARVAAYEGIAELLWRDGGVPSPQAFVDARVLYAQDQGLDSRVQRREDVHYPAAPMPCSTAGIPEQHPERCVGPAKLLPLLNDAFARGAMGEAPRVHAARIEGALHWFLYVSSLSEVMSCTNRAQDCDSCWAYYTGGTPRDSPLGLAREVAALGPEAHQRAYDGTLAVRCWRNLDNETGVAMNTTLRDRAFAQLDRALLRGLALALRQRVTELPCSTGDVLDARWAYVQVLAPLLDRAARERNGPQADVLKAELSKSSPLSVDVGAVTGALDALFPCP